MSEQQDNPDDYGVPGAEDIDFVTIKAANRDAHEQAQQERMPASHVVIIIFAVCVGFTLAALLFYIRYERRKKERLEAIKLGTSPKAERRLSATEATNRSGCDLATPTTDCSESRDDVIAQRVCVHNWVADAPSTTEQSSDEESQLSDTKASCQICQKAFETGVEVCTSRSPNCRHTFHKSCMFNWLQYQSSCPVCNEGYLSPGSAFFE